MLCSYVAADSSIAMVFSGELPMDWDIEAYRAHQQEWLAQWMADPKSKKRSRAKEVSFAEGKFDS